MRKNSRAVRGLAISADSRTIISADVGDDHRDISFWDTDSFEEYGSIVNPLPECPFSAGLMFSVFTFDGRVVVCSVRAPYAKIAVWDLEK